MHDIFFVCWNFKRIDNIENINTHNVTSMKSMFINCQSLEELDLSHFNTKNCVDISYIFSCCCFLKKLNIHNFVHSLEKDMTCLFHNC